MTKQEIFEKWKSRISHKKIEMDSLDSIKGWSRYKKYYRNDYDEALNLKIPVIKINDVYSYVRTAVSSLFARNPRIRVNPKRTQDIIPAHVTECAVNYYWNIKKIKHQIKKSIKEAKLVGYSWVKVGYETDIEKVDGVESETNEFIKNEDVFAVYVPHDEIWYDSDAQDPPYDCRWMIHKYTKSTEILRNKYNEKIQANREVKNSQGMKEEDRELTDVYEIWDKDSGKIKVYIEGLDKFAEEKDWLDCFVDENGRLEFPFVMLIFDEYIDLGEDNNLPDPEIRAFEPQILENMKLRSLQMEHIKRYNRMLVVDKTKLVDETQMEAIKRGDIAGLIEANTDPSTVFAPVPYPPVQMDAYAVGSLIAQDKDQISGQSSVERGGAAQTKTRTLGEIQQIQAGTAGRLAEQQDIVEEFTANIARKMIKVMRTYFDMPKFARISGSVSQSVVDIMKQQGKFDGFSFKFTKEDIQGEYDIDVVPGSTVPLDTAVRTQKILEMARYGQAFGLAPGTMASIQLGKNLMEENEMKEVSIAYDMDVDNMLKPKQPTPQEQLKMQQQQLNLAKSQKSLQVADNRMASNEQSTMKKKIDNMRSMQGTAYNLDNTKKAVDIQKSMQPQEKAKK